MEESNNGNVESASQAILQNMEQTQNLEDSFNAAQTENVDTGEAEETNNEEVVEESKSEEKDEFAAKFAALSRKEKAIRQRETEINEKLAALEEKLAALEKPAEPEVEEKPEIPLEYRLKSNPLQTLQELGLPYEKLTELALNDGKLTTDMQLELMKQELQNKYDKELESLRSELTEKEKAQEQARYEQEINKYVNELTDFVNSNDKYELIRANDAVSLVYQVVEDHYSETGNILSNDEAADAVEEYLLEEAKKLTQSNKLKSLFAPQEPAKPQTIEKKSQTTLSNELSSQSTSDKIETLLSDDQSKAKAAELLKWND